MDNRKNDEKAVFGIRIYNAGSGRWSFGFNIAYEDYRPASSELYLNIYLGKYQVSIGKMRKDF